MSGNFSESVWIDVYKRQSQGMGKYGQKDWFKRREIVKREWNGININGASGNRNPGSVSYTQLFRICLFLLTFPTLYWLLRKSPYEVVSFIVHLDELNPHIHCTLLPIKDSRFAYKEIFAGKDKFEYPMMQMWYNWSVRSLPVRCILYNSGWMW